MKSILTLAARSSNARRSRQHPFSPSVRSLTRALVARAQAILDEALSIDLYNDLPSILLERYGATPRGSI